MANEKEHERHEAFAGAPGSAWVRADDEDGQDDGCCWCCGALLEHEDGNLCVGCDNEH